MKQTKEQAIILIVDHDQNIRESIRDYLGAENYIVKTASFAEDALGMIKEETPDLILMDMALPDANGLNVLMALHKKTLIPVILMSEKADTTDRIIGLEMGADDYLAKPVHLREISARIKCVLRRTQAISSLAERLNIRRENKDRDVMVFGNWILNCGKYELRERSGELIDLTAGEFRLLCALVHSAGHVLKREELYEITHGMDFDPFDRSIDIQIGRLRKKLGDDPHHPSLIKTVRSVGYIFIADVEKMAA